VRLSPVLDREVARRRVVTIRTPWGEVRAKEKWVDGERIAVSPEYDDCAETARRHDMPLQRVMDTARRAAENSGQDAAP
jgi:uncharacterized protein (DUF111 family)